MDMQAKKDLQKFAVSIRKETMRAIGTLGVGHVGGALSICDVLAVLYAADEAKLDAAEEVYRGALTVSQEPPAPVKLIFARVDRGGVTML